MFDVHDHFADPAARAEAAAVIENAAGRGAGLVLVDHAANHMPERLGTLGLQPADLQRHIAWDPGALGVARRLAAELDWPLVRSCVSRLVIDCNRDPTARDSIVEIGEMTPVPGNRGLDPAERARRVREVYEPFHAAVDAACARLAARGPFVVVSVHSFTPVFKGVARPWEVGILFDTDMRLARPLIAALSRQKGLVVGENEPYSPKDGVYHTLDRHGQGQGRPTAMIEVRNDLIATDETQLAWGSRLAEALRDAVQGVLSVAGGGTRQKSGA